VPQGRRPDSRGLRDRLNFPTGRILHHNTREENPGIGYFPESVKNVKKKESPMNISNPLIVQSNSTLLLEVNNPLFADARDAITTFAHLEKSPEHIHTYSITPLSLWNAAALGMTPADVVALLDKFSKLRSSGKRGRRHCRTHGKIRQARAGKITRAGSPSAAPNRTCCIT